MKHILAIVFITLLSFNISANTTQSNELFTPLNNTEQSDKCNALKADGATKEQLAQRGCCSWHQGVCGCSNGRTTCCDGSTSPTCTCHKADEGKSEI